MIYDHQNNHPILDISFFFKFRLLTIPYKKVSDFKHRLSAAFNSYSGLTMVTLEFVSIHVMISVKLQ